MDLSIEKDKKEMPGWRHSEDIRGRWYQLMRQGVGLSEADLLILRVDDGESEDTVAGTRSTRIRRHWEDFVLSGGAELTSPIRLL